MSDLTQLKAALRQIVETEGGLRPGARRIKCGANTLKGWLEDAHGMTLTSLLKVVEATGTPIEDLLGLPHYKPRAERLWDALSKLTDRRSLDLEIAEDLAAKRQTGN